MRDKLSSYEANALVLARERLAERERERAEYQATRARGKRTLREIVERKEKLGIGRWYAPPLPAPDPVPEPAHTHCCCCHREAYENQHPVETAFIKILTISFLLRH